MSAEQLNAIKERAAKATPGPWESDCFGVGVAPYGSESDLAHVNDWDDATFIAHAREDVSALVAEVERLRAELEDIFAVATEEAACLSYESGYEDIVKIANDALK